MAEKPEDMAETDILTRLQPYLPPPPGRLPPAVADLLPSVEHLAGLLGGPERRVTVVGALQVGKSSLLNALIGTDVLPVRANRATGTVTVLTYGAQPAATVMWQPDRGSIEENIPFDAAGRWILLDLETPAGAGRREVEEIRLHVPLPLLARHLVLVDTPGLVEDAALSERTYAEIERSDLAVMVLAADKILSTEERTAAARIDEVLHGNIVYVVNRLDLIDEGDREEVIDWARTALTGSGNDLVGSPTVFAVTARDGGGVAPFRQWLSTCVDGERGARLAALARLGRLERRLEQVGVVVAGELAACRHAMDVARREEAAALSRERAEMKGRTSQARAALALVRADLSDLLSRFVAECVAGTLEQHRGTEMASTIPVVYEPARRRFAEAVSTGVQAAIEGLPLPPHRFDLSGWIVRADVPPVHNPAGEVGARFGDLTARVFGGTAGRDAGASIGGWIDKNVLGVDAEREMAERIERTIRGVLPSLQHEAERYVAQIDSLLAAADAFHDRWTRDAPTVAVAEAAEERCAELLRWSGEFLRETQVLTRELQRS